MAEPLNAAVRQAARKRRIPAGARCTCGVSDPVVLEPWGKTWRCYECANPERKRPPQEAHHVLGKDVDPTVAPLNGNLHRQLSEMQRDLPAEIRARAPHDPLAFAITVMCAIRDFAIAMAKHLAAVIAWLMRLWEALREKHGKDWVTNLGLPPLHPAVAK